MHLRLDIYLREGCFSLIEFVSRIYCVHINTLITLETVNYKKHSF